MRTAGTGEILDPFSDTLDGDHAPVNFRQGETTMPRRLDYLKVANGDLVRAKGMPDALTAATLVFGDGAGQTSRRSRCRWLRRRW